MKNENILRLDGVIASENMWGDEITPAQVFSALEKAKGEDFVLWLNSPGGDCVAASRIYTMLMDYRGKVTIKIDGVAYSAASVVAMAGTQVLMSPTALIMLHNPWCQAIGDYTEMLTTAAALEQVKEAIISAYEMKTGINRFKLSEMMDSETFINAHEAVRLGFADGLLFEHSAITATHKEPTETTHNKLSFAALQRRLVAMARTF